MESPEKEEEPEVVKGNEKKWKLSKRQGRCIGYS
jgi:hypothetical protein